MIISPVKLRAKSFFSNQKGLALVEFAFVAPLLLVLFFGVFELTRYILILQKVERSAYATSNIVSQYLPAQNPTIDPVNEISKNVMDSAVFPQVGRMLDSFYAPDNTRSIVTSVVKNASGTTTINWQIASGETFNDAVSIVNGLPANSITPAVKDTQATFSGDAAILAETAGMTIGENLIVVEVFYHYEPIVSDILARFGSPSLAQRTIVSRSYTMPRQGNLLYLPPDFPVAP